MFAHHSSLKAKSPLLHCLEKPFFSVAVSLLAILLLLGCALNPTSIPTPATVPIPTTAPTLAPNPTATLTSQGLGERAYSYVLRLSSEPRAPAIGGEGRAAQLLAQWFQEAGYQAKLEGFPVSSFSGERPGLTLLDPAERGVLAFPLTSSASGEGEGGLIYIGLGRPEDIPLEGLRGKVALVQRGQLRFQEKVENAARAGAVAVVIFNDRPGPFQGGLVSPSPIPAVSIAQEDGQSLRETLAKGEEIKVRVWVRWQERQAQNVVAEVPGTGPDLVILGAHYDSVLGSPGASDNASGTAVLLTVAQELRGRTWPFTLRLIAFGAEEEGLWGSRHHAQKLSAEERSSVRAMVSIDVVGSGIVSLKATGHQRLASRMEQVAQRLGLALETGPATNSDLSDHVPFLQQGMPAVLLHTPDYARIHSPEDKAEFVTPGRLGEAVTLLKVFLEDLAQEN